MLTRLLVLSNLALVACAYGDPGHPRLLRGDGTVLTPPQMGGGGARAGGGADLAAPSGSPAPPTSSTGQGPNCAELEACCGASRGYYAGCNDYQHGDEQQCLDGLGLFCASRPNPENGDGSQCDGSIANDRMIDCAMTVTYP
jgi:hypothetical protein